MVKYCPSVVQGCLVTNADRKLGLMRVQSGTWVQTDRQAHEKWATLSITEPRASSVMHVLVSKMGRSNAIVISQRNLSRLTKCSRQTVVRAIKILKQQNWIEVRQIGPTGTTNAYIINDRVAWSGKRDGIRYSLFSATVVISDEDQPDKNHLDGQPPIATFPFLYPGEQQLPTGPGLPPPSEPQMPGLETDIPSHGAPDSENLNAD